MTLNNGFFNPPGAGADELGLQSDFEDDGSDDDDSGDLVDKYRKHLRQGALAAILYGLYAAAEAYSYSAAFDDIAATHFEAASRLLIVGIPTTLMFFRRGFFSALALTGLALLNMISVLLSWQAGEPDYNITSVIFNLVFAGMFVRSAFAVRQLRRT